MVIALPVLAAAALVPALVLAPADDDDDDAAPWMPELQASSRAPPPTTTAPTPAARNRLRLETRPAVGWLSVLSGWAVWSVMVWISPCMSTHPSADTRHDGRNGDLEL